MYESRFQWKHVHKYYYNNLKNLKSSCEKRDAFDCAGIRARIFRLPLDGSNQLSYTGVSGLKSRHGRKCLFFHRKISNSSNCNLICIIAI